MLNERFCVFSSINNDHGKYTYDHEKSRKSYVNLKHDTLRTLTLHHTLHHMLHPILYIKYMKKRHVTHVTPILLKGNIFLVLKSMGVTCVTCHFFIYFINI